MNDTILKIVIVVLLLGGGLAYIRYDAVQDERAKVEAQAAKDYQALNDKYNAISEQYNTLKAAKETKRQEQVVREDKIVYENREYYAGDCFDAVGLQHIQNAQRTDTK